MLQKKQISSRVCYVLIYRNVSKIANHSSKVNSNEIVEFIIIHSSLFLRNLKR